ncbi:hypothetical protein BDW42DRAFT_193030 [Aspergillus taichungensis]|uniref:Uncharacterized protein n=1 Tax=Aspergillus taichungensis TaxID=482145 RepID=A0A2J5HYE7_9EURO|nr:hypothetical protein BDW42DRAFT_193030 [Aspergillus taichungensis]
MNPFTNLSFHDSDSDSDRPTTLSPPKPFVSFNDGDGALVWYNSYCDPTADDRVWWLRLAMEGHYTKLSDLLFDMTLAYDHRYCQVVPIFNHDMDGSMYMGFNVPAEVEAAGREAIMALGGKHLMRVVAYYKEHKSFPTPVHNAPKDESASGESGSERDDGETPPTSPEGSSSGFAVE